MLLQLYTCLRGIPYALRDKLRDQLQCMEKLDIIEKVSEPTDWVNTLELKNARPKQETHFTGLE